MRKYIIAFLLSALLMPFESMLVAQNKTVTVNGVVLDKQGESIIGASVIIAGSKKGTITDVDGKFSIETEIGKSLKISFLGFKAVEPKISSADLLQIVLEDDSYQFDDFVVVGYGVQKKSDLTASISSVKADAIAATATTSLDQGLQGRASGVVVLNTSGQPGGATSIRIRGTSSINGTNEPLYVIDGIPIVNEASTSSTGALKNPALNPLSSINPSDIASLEVLKDASATSIYGARGANGVILITTKQGKSGKTKVSASVKYVLQEVSKKMKMMNALQVAEIANEAADNDGVERKPIYAGFNNLSKNNTDWQDEIFRIAPMQSYDVSISGGGDKNTYFTSANLLKQEGVIIESDFSKGTLRFNSTQKISNYVQVGVTSNATYSRSHGVVTNSEGGFASSITSWALAMNPALQVKDANGNYIYQNDMTPGGNVGNPVQDAKTAQNRTTTFKGMVNAFVEVKPMKELVLKSSFGLDYFTVKDQSFAPRDIKRAESNKGYANIGNSDGYTWVTENTATFMKSFDKHSFNALAGVTAQKFESESSLIAVADFEDATLGFNSIQSSTLKQLALSGSYGWQMISYLARINYNFDNRYLFTVTGRIDGSSKFGEKHRYGTFPSAAFAWRASEEKFLKNNKTISNLKFRASHGVVGNEGIASYTSQGLLNDTEAYFGNSEIVKGKVPISRSNENLKWETTTQTDLGYEVGFFNNRLSINGDFYLKTTKDLLLMMPNLLHSGYDYGMRNVGDMQNKGFEIAINAIPLNGKLTWNTDFTLGYNKNEVTDLQGSKDNLTGNEVLGISYWTKITKGKPIGTFYGYKTDGIVQKNEDPSKIAFFPGKTLRVGDRKYVNQNDDKILDEGDLVELGKANPDFTFGFSNSFKYNLQNGSALNLSLFLQGVTGNQLVNFNKFDLESLDGYRNNSINVLDRWTINNPTNEYPRATMMSHGVVVSDHTVEDASYLRVKDITLGYDFSPTLAKRLFCSSISAYVSLKNIYTFTNYSGYDPEVSRFANNNLSMGADFGSYPMAKLYECGVKINF